ncbi:MAG: hypothetical protein II467_06595 [Bacilli bacterium]|nr:hypothetical protein [Bacilli bacterium]
MIISLQEFHTHVGEVLMYCQCIEHDIHHIYAYMADGGVGEKLLKIEQEKWTLGQTVTKLKEYDQSWKKPLFSQEDYDILFIVVKYRNYYAHFVYPSFCYLDDEAEFEKTYNRAANKLLKDKETLSRLYGTVEDVRIRYCDLSN